VSDFHRDKCLYAMRKLNDKIKDKVVGTIYHYTKAEKFKEIIKTREIWMTNALFVNDTTELRASLEGDIFKDIQFKNPEFSVFQNTQKKLESKDVEDYYLASFSKDNNSLYQFRSYGDYCIGFDAKKLKKNRFNLFKCVYKQRDIKNWIVKKDSLAEWQDDCFNNEKGQSYKRTAFLIVKSARQAKLKSEHYELEKEIRLLVASNSSWDSGLGFSYGPEMFCEQPAIYFRKHNFSDVPYVKFFIPKKPKTRKELEKLVKNKSQIETKNIIRNMEMGQEKELLPISTVKIGPMQNQEEALITTKTFLHEHGYDKVEVTSSDIPYRGF